MFFLVYSTKIIGCGTQYVGTFLEKLFHIRYLVGICEAQE